MKLFRNTGNRALHATFILLVTLLVGCSSVSLKGKVTDTTVADLPVFADETIALLGGEAAGLSKNETVLIREYLTGEEPSEVLADDIALKADQLLVAITDYSIDIAMLSETINDEEQRRMDYIDSLTKFERTVTEVLELEALNLAANVENAAEQTMLLDAMRAGQPVVDALGRHGLQILSQHDEAINTLAQFVDDGIEADYAGLYAYGTWLTGHRDAVLTDLEALIEAEAEGKDITSQEEELIDRLEIIHGLAMEMEPHWRMYRATQRELDKIHVDVLDASNRTRMILLIWVRAHARMTSGRIQDAEWFTLKDLGAVAFKYGGKLL